MEKQACMGRNRKKKKMIYSNRKQCPLKKKKKSQKFCTFYSAVNKIINPNYPYISAYLPDCFQPISKWKFVHLVSSLMNYLSIWWSFQQNNLLSVKKLNNSFIMVHWLLFQSCNDEYIHITMLVLAACSYDNNLLGNISPFSEVWWQMSIVSPITHWTSFLFLVARETIVWLTVRAINSFKTGDLFQNMDSCHALSIHESRLQSYLVLWSYCKRPLKERSFTL